MVTSREIRLQSRPSGTPALDNFELATVEVPDPGPGEVQVKNLWMTVDPYMRGRMVDSEPDASRTERKGEPHAEKAIASPSQSFTRSGGGVVSTLYGWRAPFQLGEPLEGGAIGEVTTSNDVGLQPGDLVFNTQRRANGVFFN